MVFRATGPASTDADHPLRRIGREGLLLQLSQHIEDQGMQSGTPPVVVSSFQTASRFTRATERRYRSLAERCPLVCAIGLDLSPDRHPALRAVSLDAGDPLLDEWTVTVVGNHFAAALIARDMGDDGPDHDRRFEFVVTHDRDLVTAAARLAHGSGQRTASLTLRVGGHRAQGVSASILGMRHQTTLNSFAVSMPHSETYAETRRSPRPPCSR